MSRRKPGRIYPTRLNIQPVDYSKAPPTWRVCLGDRCPKHGKQEARARDERGRKRIREMRANPEKAFP